jgi:hypothetical protein
VWSEDVVISIVAGIAATTLMTAFVLAFRIITGERINVVRILGTMLTSSTTPAGRCSEKPGTRVAGIIAHYSVGIFFSFVYLWLWQNEIIKTDLITTTLLGFITGLIGITVWRLYFLFHSHPPAVPLKLYLTCILFAHVIFAWTARWLALNWIDNI